MTRVSLIWPLLCCPWGAIHLRLLMDQRSTTLANRHPAWGADWDPGGRWEQNLDRIRLPTACETVSFANLGRANFPEWTLSQQYP